MAGQDTISSPMPIWVSDDAIDLAWIRQAMPDFQDATKCHVKDISNTTRKGDVAKNGATLRLTLTIPSGEDKTTIIKQVPPSGLPLSRQLGLAREAFFFNDLAPRVKMQKKTSDDEQSCSTPCIPKIYYSYGDMQDGSKVVIMEDLGGKYVDSGILFGPGNPNNWMRDLDAMISEAYPPGSSSSASVKVPTSFEVANQTFLAIAQVHATFWKDSELLKDDYHWLRGSSWVQGKGEASWKASQGLIQGMWSRLLDSGAVDSRIQWDPLVKETVSKAMASISWESQLDRLNVTKNCHWTLVHGDFWPGNVMICKTNVHDLRLLDWEMTGLGSGPQDLGQYVLSNMDPTERREGENQLVRNYYNELINLGVQDLTWEECWKEYTIGGLERWLWFLVYFCAQEGPLLDWAQFFHDQIKEFMYDHSIKPQDICQPRP